jgi:hypothetical protein
MKRSSENRRRPDTTRTYGSKKPGRGDGSSRLALSPELRVRARDGVLPFSWLLGAGLRPRPGPRPNCWARVPDPAPGTRPQVSIVGHGSPTPPRPATADHPAHSTTISKSPNGPDRNPHPPDSRDVRHHVPRISISISATIAIPPITVAVTPAVAISITRASITPSRTKVRAERANTSRSDTAPAECAIVASQVSDRRVVRAAKVVEGVGSRQTVATIVVRVRPGSLTCAATIAGVVCGGRVMTGRRVTRTASTVGRVCGAPSPVMSATPAMVPTPAVMSAAPAMVSTPAVVSSAMASLGLGQAGRQSQGRQHQRRIPDRPQ